MYGAVWSMYVLIPSANLLPASQDLDIALVLSLLVLVLSLLRVGGGGAGRPSGLSVPLSLTRASKIGNVLRAIHLQ